MRCGVSEPEMVTLSRFRAGLNDEIKRELFLKEVHDLEHAYQISLDSERFQRKPAAHPSNPSPVRRQRCQVRRLEQAWCDASLSKFLPRCDGEKVLGATPRTIRVRRPSPINHLILPQLLLRFLKTTAPPKHHQSGAILFPSILSPVDRLLGIFLANPSGV